MDFQPGILCPTNTDTIITIRKVTIIFPQKEKVFYESNASFSKSGIKFNVYFMNSLNARKHIAKKRIKAKGLIQMLQMQLKLIPVISPERSQLHTKQILQHPYHFYSQFQCNPFTLQYQNMIGKAVLRIHKIIVNNKFIMYEKT